MLSQFDADHMDEIIHGHGTWFTAHLIRLCTRADDLNLAKLRVSFPEVVDAYLKWRSGNAA